MYFSVVTRECERLYLANLFHQEYNNYEDTVIDGVIGRNKVDFEAKYLKYQQ